MADIVLALKPKWLELILSGKKTAEFRRVMPKKLKRDDKVYLYCQGDIHGYAIVTDVERVDPRDDSHAPAIADTFEDWGCLTSDEILDYWEGAKSPGMILLINATRYDDPHPWRGTTPQNFIYYR